MRHFSRSPKTGLPEEIAKSAAKRANAEQIRARSTGVWFSESLWFNYN
jgi:hypothetical protein